MIAEEKQWAEGLNQASFEIEWMRKFPRSDYIPDLDKWLLREPAKYNGIDGVKEDDYENEICIDKRVEETLKKKKEEPEIFAHCKGCGKIFGEQYKDKRARRMAKVGHERHCKLLLEVRT